MFSYTCLSLFLSFSLSRSLSPFLALALFLSFSLSLYIYIYKQTKHIPAAVDLATPTKSDTDSPQAPAPAGTTHSSEGLCPTRMMQKRASRVVKTFIASFRKSEATPPCRSYQSLVALCEFNDFFERFKDAQQDSDLKSIREDISHSLV